MSADQPILLPCLDEAENFPAVHMALKEPNGLLAYGGDLSEARLLKAYRRGIFPWYNPGEEILWWSPDPRTVLYPNALHLSRRLQRSLRASDHRVHWNRDFAGVMRHCAARRKGQSGTWISTQMLQAYQRLFDRGHAFCLEIETDRGLAGGIYGVHIGRMLFGESMFSAQTNGSKLALYELTRWMLRNDHPLLDCQVDSAHLRSLGALSLPRAEFVRAVQALL